MDYRTIGYKSYGFILFYGIIEAFLITAVVVFAMKYAETKENLAILIIASALVLVALVLFIFEFLEPKKKIQIDEKSLKLGFRNKETVILFDDFLDANIYGKSVISKSGKLKILTKKGFHFVENVADVEVVKTALLQAAYSYKIKEIERQEGESKNEDWSN